MICPRSISSGLKILGAFFILGFFCSLRPVPVYAQKDYLSSIEGHLQRLESRYGISFKYKDFPEHMGPLMFSEVSQEEWPLLDDYLSLFELEINKYPPGFFKGGGIRGIGLVTALFRNEKPVEGLYAEKARIMFFDISRFSHNEAMKRHSIHHEIFHMMSLSKKGYPQLGEKEWAALNEPGFTYGKQTKSLREPNPYNISAPNQPGFVTYYAMASVAEDQAEVFACLMQERHRRLIEKWMLKDDNLRKKIQIIKGFSEFYYPRMNEKYLGNEVQELYKARK